ncbi:MAG: DUF3021 domain-containing protein [Anaerolineaceae bacterium]|nr:DUF3021 domain-containing protein [Anaerolineaceae bacterium]
MEKKNVNQFFERAGFGFLVGIFSGLFITIVLSFFAGDGKYHVLSVSFAKTVSSELMGVIITYALCGLLGAIMGLCSILYEHENRNLLQKTVLHLLITLGSFLWVAWILKWFTPTIGSLIGFSLSYIISYFMIWLVMYLGIRTNINAINQKLEMR